MSGWISGAFGLVGVVIGATITQGAAWWQKRKRHLAYWSAMSAEIDLCREDAAAYIRDLVIAPLTRLSTLAYASGFPALLGDGAVSGDEAKAMLAFYDLVGQINRGIEQANDALGPNGEKTERSVRESNRLDVKCKRLVADGGPYDAARAVISAHL